MEITGKVAIVTGGARGLGKEYVKGILEKGGKVLITDLLQDVGAQTEAQLRAIYGQDRVHFVSGDVSNDEHMAKVFSECDSIFGKVDILVNNAGVGEKYVSVDTTLTVNIGGTIKCSRLALERMDKTLGGKGGIIVNISSVAGLRADPWGTVYRASKHAVVGYSRCLGVTLASDGLDHGVTVACLAPCYAKTELTRGLQEAERQGDTRMLSDVYNQGGWTDAEDIVAACVKVIETPVPQACVIKVSSTDSTYVFPESMTGKLF